MSTLADHIPNHLVYGPVQSRRFGRSLGISFSAIDRVGCTWQCPYCQLGGGHPQPNPPFPAATDIIAACDKKISAGPIDVVCICGNGEPSEHPEFASLINTLRSRCHTVGLPLILLTNGDGLIDNDRNQQAAHSCDQCWIKDDPGPRHGAWRSGIAERDSLLASMPQLHIQSLLFTSTHPHMSNSHPEHRTRWLQRMRTFLPDQVHLTTIERAPRLHHLRPVSNAVLNEWRADLQSNGIAAEAYL